MFQSLYLYFRDRKLLLLVVCFLVLCISVFAALHIKTTEDLSKIIPADKDLQKYNAEIQKIKFNEQIIVHVFAQNKAVSPDHLTAFSDSLEQQLLNCEAKKYILEIKNKQGNQTLSEVYKLFYKQLALFLTPDDYSRIQTLLQKDSLEKTLQSNFKTLISPASIITKKFIRKDPLHLTPIALKKLNHLKFDDHFTLYANHILSEDKQHLMFFVQSKFDSEHIAENEHLSNLIQQKIKQTQQKFPNIKAEIFGTPAIAAQNAVRIKKDIQLTVLLAVVLLFLFLSIIYRKINVIFLIFLPAVFGAGIALTVLWATREEISALTLGIGTIMLGISIDYSLHILTHAEKKERIQDIFRDIAGSILMSSLTTAAAFFCLLFMSSQVLRDLGLFAGISVISAAIFALLVLPHLLKKQKKVKRRKLPLERLSAYPFHKNKYLIIILLGTTFAAFFYFHKSEFESDMDKMNYMSPEMKIAEKNIREISSNALRKMYVLVSEKNLENALRANDKLAEKLQILKNRGDIGRFSSVSYFLVSDSLQKNRIARYQKFWQKEKIDSLENNLSYIGQQYGFKHGAFSGFIDHLRQKPQLLSSQEKELLIKLFGSNMVNHEANGAVSLVNFVHVKQDNKKTVYQAIGNQKNIYIIDKKYITDKIVQILQKDFNLLAKISFIVVFLILLLYFGRIELTIITLVPMGIAWIWTLALMYWFGIKFTIFNIIISTFIFGLGIDYSIFITNGLLQNYRYGTKHIASYKRSVLISGITTATAIGVLIFARHPAMHSIAVLSLSGITSVIFITYTLQPILFNFLVKQQGKKRKLPITIKEIFFNIILFAILLTNIPITIFILLFIRILPISTKIKKSYFHKILTLKYRIITGAAFHIKRKVYNPHNEDFRKSAVIVANHQSHIDIPVILRMHPKILILTNDWVQKNIFYGKFVRYADYYPVNNGFEKNLELIRQKVAEGYSLLIFPEGTRNPDKKTLLRFHQGAFRFAQQLNLDILPLILQGTGDCMSKGEPFLRSGRVTISIMQRISPENFAKNPRGQAKLTRRLMLQEYQAVCQKEETVDYYRKQLIYNYIYKTPVLEHYTRIKTKIEKNYRFFDHLLPRQGHITDIGTGYGYLPYMLSFTAPERTFTGIDYDEQKINTAKHNISKSDRLQFMAANVLQISLPPSEAFILNDVLHYMPKEEQESLIIKCLEKLKGNGILIIRDGNAAMKRKHQGTRLSEFFSTRFLKFNKTIYDKLYFTTEKEIRSYINPQKFSVEIVDETNFTSNIVFVIKKM